MVGSGPSGALIGTSLVVPVSPGVRPAGLVNAGLRPVVGDVSEGDVSAGVVRPGVVSEGVVSPGVVRLGAVTDGGVTAGVLVVPGTVSAGLVNPGLVSDGSVRFGVVAVTCGTVAAGAVSPGVVNPGGGRPGVVRLPGEGVRPPGDVSAGLVVALGDPARLDGMLGTTMPNCERLDCRADMISPGRSVIIAA